MTLDYKRKISNGLILYKSLSLEKDRQLALVDSGKRLSKNDLNCNPYLSMCYIFTIFISNDKKATEVYNEKNHGKTKWLYPSEILATIVS